MTDFAPFSMAYFMVGIAPTIRWGFVTFLSESRGTLKSTYQWISYGRRLQSVGLCEASGIRHPWDTSSTHPYENPLVFEVHIRDGKLVGERHDVQLRNSSQLRGRSID